MKSVVVHSVYEAKVPAATEDFEYYVTAGDKLVCANRRSGIESDCRGGVSGLVN